jgi:hypothetical protein
VINYSHFAIYGSCLIKFSRKEDSFTSTENFQKIFQNLRYMPRVCKGLYFGLKAIHFALLTLLLLQRYSNMSVNIFSVFTLSRNVFKVLLMNIFYHFNFYFPLCFLLLSFHISSFFYNFYTFFIPFSNCFPQTALNFGICSVKRGLKM